MKHFTPERWLRMQDMTRPDEVRAALQEWQRATEDYRSELNRILPAGDAYADLRGFAKHIPLHDGLVLANWYSGGRLHFVVRLEPPEYRLVTLTYDLADEPSVVAHAFPDDLRTDELEWMYDEVSLSRPASHPEAEAVYQHNVLLGNGWELCIPFSNVRVGRPTAWLPPPETSTDPSPWSMTSMVQSR